MPRPRKSAAKTVPTQEAATLPMVLPPQEPAAVLSSSQLPAGKPANQPAKRDRTILPSNSLVRQKVLAIIGLRLEGKNTKEISEHLHLTEPSIRQYMWLAGKNGWLKKHAIDPGDRLEHEIAHKVVRNLDEMLDSADEDRRDVATLKTAEGMLFKRYGTEATSLPPMAVIGIRIEMPTGAAATSLREGTTGGAGRFIEGQAIDAVVEERQP